jgi:predicted DNA-binding transcriptional regulator YafY
MEFFRDCGFIVNKERGLYSIDRESPFFKRLIERVSFTEAEQIVLRRLIEKVDEKNAVVEKLKEKLGGGMDFQILNDSRTNDQQAFIISQLHEAIKYKQMAVLKGYSSPHGRTKRDRLVEPFLLMNGNNEVRCYEPASGMNKTFKVARIQQVELLSENWQHEADHRRMFTDIFMFSGEERLPVKLRMGTLAHNLMIEEYPLSAPLFEQEDQNHWLLSMDVCSYAGIGRFVLGLFEDIEVLGSQEFIQYLKEKIKGYQIG